MGTSAGVDMEASKVQITKKLKEDVIMQLNETSNESDLMMEDHN